MEEEVALKPVSEIMLEHFRFHRGSKEGDDSSKLPVAKDSGKSSPFTSPMKRLRNAPSVAEFRIKVKS